MLFSVDCAFGTEVSGLYVGSIYKCHALNLKDETDTVPSKVVTDCQSILRNIPEDRRHILHIGRSLELCAD